MNLWHDLPLSKKFPAEFPVIIEISKGSNVKYELHKDTGLIAVDRILHSAMHYPLNYGFTPRTYCKDNDPIDVLLMGEYALMPGSFIQARAIGYIEMIDDGEEDHKLIAIPVSDPELAHIDDISKVSPHLIEKIKNFFATYKIMQKKDVVINNHYSREKALALLTTAADSYLKKFPNH
ncbi:inorganic pyrophosphatase [Spirochaetota bacterium]|nr:inorganic pyrophosphatase [Spirochaetota bacterium]